MSKSEIITKKSKKKKVIIATESPLIQEGLKALLDDMKDVIVERVFHTGRELLKSNIPGKSDLIILDLELTDIDPLVTLKSIRSTVSDPVILVYSEPGLSSLFRACISLGVLGYVVKTDTLDIIKEAILSVLMGEFGVSPSVIPPLNARSQIYAEFDAEVKVCERMLGKLTERESEVQGLVLKGHTSSEIGKMLRVQRDTISKHRENIRKKIGKEGSFVSRLAWQKAYRCGTQPLGGRNATPGEPP